MTELHNPSAAPDCNCHPDDYTPVPCQHKHSYSECMRAALASAQMERDLAIEGSRRQMVRAEKAEDEIAALKRPGYVGVPRAEILGALARGYCHEGNTHKQLDSDLLNKQADEIQAMLAASGEG